MQHFCNTPCIPHYSLSMPVSYPNTLRNRRGVGGGGTPDMMVWGNAGRLKCIGNTEIAHFDKNEKKMRIY